MTNRLYYYAPQRVAVEATLRPILRDGVRLVPVDERSDAIRGIRCGCFVVIAGHPSMLPLRLREEIEIMGFLVISIDDSNARALVGRERLAAKRGQQ